MEGIASENGKLDNRHGYKCIYTYISVYMCVYNSAFCIGKLKDNIRQSIRFSFGAF